MRNSFCLVVGSGGAFLPLEERNIVRGRTEVDTDFLDAGAAASLFPFFGYTKNRHGEENKERTGTLRRMQGVSATGKS